MKPSNKEFILRTIRVIEQYENVKIKLECSYSRTLFINCCVGLLLLSKEIAYKQLPNSKKSMNDWGIDINNDKDKISICSPYISPKQIARHLRNSISHGNFDFAVKDGLSIPINHISFKDYDENENLTFKAQIPFNEFRIFVLKVSEEALKILNKE